MIQKLSLNRWTYVTLCVLACLTPVALVFVLSAAATNDDMLIAVLGTFIVMVLTYPAGAVATVFSWFLMYFGFLAPTESVLFAAPLYVAAGYIQWYVLIPRYFRAHTNPAPKVPATPSDGAA